MDEWDRIVETKGKPVNGREVSPQALEAMHTAKAAQKLRQAQAVALPLLNLSVLQTAGYWACARPGNPVLRRRFAKVTRDEAIPTPPRGCRRHQNLSATRF
jgi:hypothetical protein